MRRRVVLWFLLLWVTACQSSGTVTPETEQEEDMALKLTSPVFAHGEAIPKLYTCDGEDISPPLAWRDAPAGTQSFALICDDPDAPAGVWDHLILFNIPASATGLPEGIAERTDGSVYGKNSWRRLDYGGPCHRAARTAISSGCTPSTPRSISKQALPSAKWSARCRGTSWRRPSCWGRTPAGDRSEPSRKAQVPAGRHRE